MKIIAILLSLVVFNFPLLVNAKGFPNHKIRIVVPYKPGGPVDLLPRMVAPLMEKSLGVSIVVENKPGAGGQIGAAYVARSKPDGYTLLGNSASILTTNPFLFHGFNPAKGLTPVADIGRTMNVLDVKPNSKIKSVRQLIAMIKSGKGTIPYSTPGIGTSWHLCMELLRSMTAENNVLVHVPFQGGAPALEALLAGHVKIACANILPSIGYIKKGLLRPLAVTGYKRSPLLPNVPTVAESGLPNFEVDTWFGIAAPIDTPKARIDKLNAAVDQALRNPKIAKRLISLGMMPVGGTPESVQKTVAKDSRKWGGLIEREHITRGK